MSDEENFQLPDPDWDRVLGVVSRAQDSTGKSHTPLGDPIRWGGNVLQVISDPAVGPIAFFESPQIMRAQTTDAYPRPWALIGTVRAPVALWALAAVNWAMVLEVSQGAGQTVVKQLFDLRTLTTLGLANGYAPDFTTLGFEQRSFAIVGGVVGQNWGVRVGHAVLAGSGVVNAQVSTNIIATPFAAGTGL